MYLLEGRELLGLFVPRVVERYALDAAAGLHPGERRLARLARLGQGWLGLVRVSSGKG